MSMNFTKLRSMMGSKASTGLGNGTKGASFANPSKESAGIGPMAGMPTQSSIEKAGEIKGPDDDQKHQNKLLRKMSGQK